MPLEKLEFKNSKKVLQRRTKTLIAEMKNASKVFIEGVNSSTLNKARSDLEKKLKPPMPTQPATEGTIEIDIPKADENITVGLQMFWSQTHGCLISEWHSFLNRVFKEIVDYCLKNGKSHHVTKDLEIYLNDADFSSFANLRNSIREALSEKFSSKKHPDRLNRLRKILKINEKELKVIDPVKLQKIDGLTRVIKKHVTVRNCLEHANSKVSDRDLRGAGYGNRIPMLDNLGISHDYVEGDEIFISDKDVIELNNTIKDSVEYFEAEL